MLKIISIHINKTAGKAFRQLLYLNYGPKLLCMNVDNSNKFHRGPSCKANELESKIKNYTEVLHGHFTYKDISNLIDNNIKIIAWLREPVGRVLPNYFHDFKNSYTNLDIDDYIELEINKNKMIKMLDGINFDQCIFGLQEEFDYHTSIMADMFNWRFKKVPIINAGEQRPVSIKTIKRIEELNYLDIILYEKIKGLL